MDLKEYDSDALFSALHQHVRDKSRGAYRPLPADFLRHLEPDANALALLAWDKALRAIHRPGPYATVVFDDPLIHAVIYDVGGWIVFCQLTDKNQPFVQKEFERRYHGYLQHKQLRYPQKLVGIGEHQNQLQGFEYDQVVLLGDPQLAQQVLLQGILPEKLSAPPVMMSLEKLNDTSDL